MVICYGNTGNEHADHVTTSLWPLSYLICEIEHILALNSFEISDGNFNIINMQCFCIKIITYWDWESFLVTELESLWEKESRVSL